MRILLVEDEDSIRSALVRGLERAGHVVEAAASLAEARLLARPEAVVCDLKLPDGSGLDLVEALGVPGVVMSGYATFDDAVRALRLGCVDFLTKPVGIRDIRGAIDRIRPAVALVVDPERGVALRPGGSTETVVIRSAQWSDGEARAAWDRLRPAAVTRDQREVLAALLQGVPQGRLVINADAVSWRAWRQPGGSPPKADASMQVIAGDSDMAVTLRAGEAQDDAGEWWWPRPLVPPVDLAGVTAVGPWFLDWLRTHAEAELLGASPALRERLQAAGASPRWGDEALARPGVGRAERALLFDDG